MTTVVRLNDVGLRDDLKSHIGPGLTYTVPMPSGAWSGTKTDVGLVLLPPKDGGPEPALSFVCLATKGKRWTTRFARVEFSRLVEVAPLPVRDWLDAVPPQFQSLFKSATESSGRPIPPGTWTNVRAALLEPRGSLPSSPSLSSCSTRSSSSRRTSGWCLVSRRMPSA